MVAAAEWAVWAVWETTKIINPLNPGRFLPGFGTFPKGERGGNKEKGRFGFAGAPFFLFPRSCELPSQTPMKVFYDERMVAQTTCYSPSAAKPKKLAERIQKLGIEVEVCGIEPMEWKDFYLSHAPQVC